MFFHTSYADYAACLDGRCHLVPNKAVREGLEVDYEAMVDAGMFDKTPPPFATVMERLSQLEAEVNLIGDFKGRV